MNAQKKSDKSKIARLPDRLSIFLGVWVTVIFAVLEVISTLNSTVSTAAIGFMFLPIAAGIVFIAAGFFGFLLGIVIRGVLDRQYGYDLSFFSSLCLISLLLFYSLPFAVELSSTYRKVNKINMMNSQELEEAFANLPITSYYGYDIFLIAAIAQNSDASGELLDKIAHLNHPRLDERLGSIIDLTGKNRKGYAAIRLVEMNPNVTLDTLQYLTDSNNYYVLGDIAGNPRLPEKYLRKLYARSQNHQEGYLIEWGLAANPSTPLDILRELSKKANREKLFDALQASLNMNPNAPPDIKKPAFTNNQ
ncbi:MAG: hypothetical protein JSS50_02760 [Proteobacteria bacterium]|nr:hypothetical protein [Pseudomonadota bacterium]